MPRKQNGFGSPKSFATKGIGGVSKKTDRSSRSAAAGSYPSDRRYGTSVQRTIIERYDLESDWIRWRSGFEYYAQAVFEEVKRYDQIEQRYDDIEISTKLYQGTPDEVEVTFTAQRFPTRNADSFNHYVVKREITSTCDLFKVSEVLSAPADSVEARANNELWVKGTSGPNGALLLRMTGEHLTDGETTGVLSYVLDAKKTPALYVGKTAPGDFATITVSVPLADLEATEFIQKNNGNLRALIGEVGYIPNFFVNKLSRDFNQLDFVDGDYFFTVDTKSIESGQEFKILDNRSNFSPSLFDINELDVIYETSDATYDIAAKYTYKKDLYQRFFGEQYLTAEVVEDSAQNCFYNVLPFEIGDLRVDGNQVLLTSLPFMSTFSISTLFPAELSGDQSIYLVFSDYGFTMKILDTTNGVYNHPIEGPYDTVEEQIAANNEFSKLVWYKLINDIDPYQDPIFRKPNTFLSPATLYSCSCPNYSNALLRTPKTQQGEKERKVNRQRQYPLPTAQGRGDYDSIGLDSAAIVIQSWENPAQRLGFKLCKHSIAIMFHNRLKLQEPSTYQTIDARLQYEQKLIKDVAQTKEEFTASYTMGGISTLEVVFALAQGLNLDEVATAMVILNSAF